MNSVVFNKRIFKSFKVKVLKLMCSIVIHTLIKVMGFAYTVQCTYSRIYILHLCRYDIFTYSTDQNHTSVNPK